MICQWRASLVLAVVLCCGVSAETPLYASQQASGSRLARWHDGSAGAAFAPPWALAQQLGCRTCGVDRLVSSMVARRTAAAPFGICMDAGEKRENTKRRMLRIAELRREMAVDVQNLRTRVKENLVKRSTATLSRTEEAQIRGSFSKQEITKEITKMRDVAASKTRPGKGAIGAIGSAQAAKANKKLPQSKDLLGNLPNERRSSYERWRSRLSRESEDPTIRPGGGAGSVNLTAGGGSPGRGPRQFGPRQMIYSPPEMRLLQELDKRAKRLGRRHLHLLEVSRSLSPAPSSAEEGGSQTLTRSRSEDPEPHALYVVRHGDRHNPEWASQMDASLDRGGLDTRLARDIPLSPLGHRQSEDLGEFLRGKGVKTIISSPYIRCLQTASAVARATGAKIVVEHGLCEGPGHEMGWLPDLVERHRYFTDIDMGHVPITSEPSGENDDMSVIPRVARVAKELAPLVGASIMGGSVAIVTHASVAVALTAVLSMEPGQECFLEGGGASKTLLSLLERIDSARTAGAYELTVKEAGEGFDSTLDCLVNFLDDGPKAIPRTPAWRYTTSVEKSSAGENQEFGTALRIV